MNITTANIDKFNNNSGNTNGGNTANLLACYVFTDGKEYNWYDSSEKNNTIIYEIIGNYSYKGAYSTFNFIGKANITGIGVTKRLNNKGIVLFNIILSVPVNSEKIHTTVPLKNDDVDEMEFVVKLYKLNN